MRQLLRDLNPGETYVLQARYADNERYSDWGINFQFFTESDAIGPGPVVNLSVVTAGTSFVATWDKVITDENGGLLNDFAKYQVIITAGVVNKVVYTLDERYELTLDANRLFFGSPEGDITMTVACIDAVGNVGISDSDSASNASPAAPTGVALSELNSALAIRWDAVIEDDLVGYEVLHSIDNTSFTRVWEGLATAYVYPTLSEIVHYFKVRSVDVFGKFGESSTVSGKPIGSAELDLTPPDVPTNLVVTSSHTVVGSGHNYWINANWNDVTSPDLYGYTVKYAPAGGTWRYVDVEPSELTINDLVANTQYNIQVQSVDIYGNRSVFATSSITTSFDTQAPNTPSVPTAAGNTQSILVTHDLKDNAGVFLARDTSVLEVHMGVSAGFVVGPLTLLGLVPVISPESGAIAGGVFPAPASTASTTRYVKVVAVDRANNKSNASLSASVAPGLIQGINIVDATIGNAKIIDLSAAKLQAGTAIVNALSVTGGLTINSTGEVKSSNYAAGVTGWRLNATGLEIVDGSVQAKALLIQDSSQNLIPAGYALFDFNADWYSVNPSLTVTDPEKRITSDATVTRSVILGKYDNHSLQIVGTTGKKTYLSSGASEYNIIGLDLNTDYIISAWFYGTGSNNILAKGASGEVTGDSFTNSTTWTRRFLVWNSGTNQSMVVGFRTNANGTANIQGVQVERKLGALAAPSQFKMPGQTTIDGRGIVTGSIRSNQLSTTGDTSQPAWAINLDGDAVFNDTHIRGRAVVGGTDLNATQNESIAIQSSDYVAGVAGWGIKGDGSAEFDEGKFRGELNATGDVLVADSLQADSVSAREISAGLGGLFLSDRSEVGSRLGEVEGRGIIAWNYRNTDLINITGGGSPVVLFETDTLDRNINDKLMTIEIGPVFLYPKVAGDLWFVSATYTLNGTTPTTSSPKLLEDQTVQLSSGTRGVYLRRILYVPETATRLRIRVFIARFSGTGNADLYCNGVQNHPHISVRTEGPYFNPTGYQGDTQVPIPPTPPTRLYTITYPATWSRSYTGAGGTRFDDPVFMYHGEFPGDGNGRQKSAFNFDWQQLQIDLANSTIHNSWLTMRCKHTYNNSGTTFFLADTISSAFKPATWPGNSNVYSSFFARREEIITINTGAAYATKLRTGDATGLVIGPGNGGLGEYGYMYGVGSGFSPYIVITFTK